MIKYRREQSIRKKMSMVFQFGALFDSLTIKDNILLALNNLTSLNNNEKLDKVNSVLKQVDLSNVENLFPHDISGGMRKRVGIARAIAISPKYLLYDEPTTGLAFDDCAHLLKVLHRLVDSGNTVLLIEHHLDLIKNADWIIDLGPGAGMEGGSIMATGIPEKIAASESSSTGLFLSSMMPKPLRNGRRLLPVTNS